MPMIRPQRRRIMVLRQARARRKPAVRLTSSTFCQSSSLRRTEMASRVSPALLTRISTCPRADSASAMSLSPVAGSARSAGRIRARSPSLPASASSAGSLVPESPTVAPWAWRAAAIAPPIPPEAPVTNAFLPLRSNISNSPLGRFPYSAFRAGSTSAGRPTASVSSSRSIRLARPESTFPAPSSTRRSTPSAFRRRTLSRQRTMPVTCCTSWRRMVSGSLTGAALTLATRGTVGGRRSAVSRASSISRAAGSIRAQWKGALTGSRMPRLAPFSPAIVIARSTALRCPLTTTCPGPLSLAQEQTSPCAASAATSSATGRSSPSRAAMAPSPTGTASCIARPRRFNSRAASARLRAPEAASAEYSPSEWPATKAALSASRKPPSLSRTRTAARLTAINAGWAFSVRVSSCSGPSKMSRLRRWPSASSISSKTSRAGPKASASARPMPTPCEPWPGKTKPVDIPILLGRPPPAKWRALRPAPAGVSSRPHPAHGRPRNCRSEHPAPARFAGDRRALRQLERAEPVEKGGIEGFAPIDREIDLAVAKALQRLAEALEADGALAPHAVDIDLQRDHLLRGTGLVKHIAGRADEDRAADPAGREPVDIDPIALVLRRRRPAHGEFDIAVEGIGQGGMQDHLRPHGGQGAGRLRKPHVVADRDAEASRLGHVEDDELAAGSRLLLIGPKGKHL